MIREKRKVYIYTRVSTSIQIDGYSLDAQKSRMKAFCDFNDYVIAGEYEDAGKSGKTVEGRVAFNQMIEEMEVALVAAKAKKRSILSDKISGDNIYKALVFFDRMYDNMNEAERREFIEQLIEKVEVYDERQSNGQWLKAIEFKLPIIEHDMKLSLDNGDSVETVCLLSKLH